MKTLALPNRNIHFPRRPLLFGGGFPATPSLDAPLDKDAIQNMIRQGADGIELCLDSLLSNQSTSMSNFATIAKFLEIWKEIIANVTPRDAQQVFPPILMLQTQHREVFPIATNSGIEILHYTGNSEIEIPNFLATSQCAFMLPVAMMEMIPDEILPTRILFNLKEIHEEANCGSIFQQWKQRKRLLHSTALSLSTRQTTPLLLTEIEQQELTAHEVAKVVFAAKRGCQVFRVRDVNACWLALQAVSGILSPDW